MSVKPSPGLLKQPCVNGEFRNVSFRYSEGSANILDGLSFHIHPNEKIALVGVNGAGKTTIIKLLCGFYKASDGAILINGYNIDRFKRADLYTLFSAVFQEICLLPLTVGENITFMSARETDEEKIMYCLEMAGMKDKIMKYKQKLELPC